jgi:hypothetical protein
VYKLIPALLLSTLACTAANAKIHTLTFKSSVLRPADGRPGIPGATRFQLSISIAKRPPKGACAGSGITVNSFTDGANSNVSLAAAGYSRNPQLSFEIVCTDAQTGRIVKNKTTVGETWTQGSQGGAYTAAVSLNQTTIGWTFPPDNSYVSQAQTGKWRITVAP